MKEHEIIAAVRRTAGLADAGHAEAATRATLTVLGQRLAGGEPGDLAGQLPAGIREALPETGEGASFGVEEFYRRVMDAEGHGCTQDGAREHARAVIAALKAGVSQGEFDHLERQLPADYRQDLLSTAPVDQHR
ncbi:DUF2267 domain-containing protein [Amycolatopsis granulosa]|uniref:DUF2267 domain-containing protein n=1 Tax=Amycolatopsis granulosa TaxID=185684 RepID=UPI001423C9FE|nr:DUF2267 domain-containing protein [Amycolatopsis granulosa]NIH83593.1 uncharacterized protein (DUF2267 family) [Amycolatopsis granulosa]